MSGSVELAGGSSGVGQRTFESVTIQNGKDIEETLNLALNQGDNPVQIPQGSVGVIVDPIGVASTFNLLFRTNQNISDSGLPLSDVHPFLYVFPATAPTEIIINSNLTMTPGDGEVMLWFW